MILTFERIYGVNARYVFETPDRVRYDFLTIIVMI